MEKPAGFYVKVERWKLFAKVPNLLKGLVLLVKFRVDISQVVQRIIKNILQKLKAEVGNFVPEKVETVEYMSRDDRGLVLVTASAKILAQVFTITKSLLRGFRSHTRAAAGASPVLSLHGTSHAQPLRGPNDDLVARRRPLVVAPDADGGGRVVALLRWLLGKVRADCVRVAVDHDRVGKRQKLLRNSIFWYEPLGLINCGHLVVL